ncbi:MAG: FtsW/RodA/SpoVE family cell cycle protein [Pyrinomonadaceae bacterium]|nr:FtsW/RodA/SpoVE family cell cycle protein [Pyrinomonadaceae bacterium]
MKNRASSHLVALFIIIGFEIVGYYAIHRAGLIRGYETSWVSGVRDLLLFVPITILVFWLTRVMRFVGNWTLFTTAILLFSVGLLVQYRLYSDPEYNAPRGKKEAAREEKTGVMRERFIQETYTADKKQMMGLPATPPQAIPIDEANAKKSPYTIGDALTAGTTWIPLISFMLFALSFWLCTKDRVLLWIQRHSFLIVLVTLIPLAGAVVTSQAGKVENMTPWEPSKIPFLLGFAGILTARYKDLARTYWGLPRAQDVVPLVVMAVLPFLPFFVLKDFGQMLVFSGAYATLYLVAVRRWPQLILFVGSVALVAGILVVGALPRDIQEKVPLLPAVARPVKAVLPDRIQQRFHLWLDGFTPPSPDTPWWKDKYDRALAKEREKWDKSGQREIMEKSFDAQKFNRDVWFDDLAFQPAQAIFGVASGGTTGRGIGLGFSELIPIADSDYIYAAISEELGLAGGAIVILALIVFVCAGVRTSIESRDMFTKLSSAGLTAFIGFQALVNIGGITRALPMTGITLPFVSHGGFSLMTSFAMLGMLMAFSHLNARDTIVAARTVRQQARRDPSIPEAVQ